MRNYVLAAALMLAVFSAHAGNGNNNDGCQGNCSGGGGDVTANGGDGGNGYGGSGGNGTGVGIGVGVGLGGSAVAQGGEGGRGGDGGNGVGFGGSGGSVVGSGNSSNLNSNKNDATAISGSKSDSASTSGADAKASATNGNNTINGGDVSQRGGDFNYSSTYVAKRNAPGAYAPNVYPTATCQKSVSFGLSSLWGGGSAGISYADQECQTVVLAQNLASIGMTDTACDVLTTSGAWARAVAAKPELANVSCRIAKDAAKVLAEPQALAPVIEFPASDRTPRG